MDATLTVLARLLKERTAPSHRQVEDRLGLLEPTLTARSLAGAVQRLYGFWAANEPPIDEWLRRHPSTAQSIDWPRRQRTHLFAIDLQSMEASTATSELASKCPPVFTTFGAAQVFGWLYVAEGSTLGGAIIARRLHERADIAVSSLCGFTPYAEGPGPMWQAFSVVLHQWVGDDAERRDSVVRAAVTTFVSLEAWLTACDSTAVA